MRSRARDTTALAAGSVFSGILIYLFFITATRALGPELAAPVSIVWTYWSFVAAALTFPLQHWIARSAAAEGGEGAVDRALPGVAVAITLASVLAGLLAWLAREPLFHRDDLGFPVIIALVTFGSALIGIVRGRLSARHRFYAVASSLVAENAVRFAGAIALAIAGVRSPLAYGVCLAAGALVVLLWPSSFRFTRTSGAHDAALAFLGGAAAGQLIGQAILTGGPIVLALSGGSPVEVTGLFAALALFRAPYTLAIGLLSQLTGRLTSMVVDGRERALRAFRLSVFAGTAVMVVVAGAIGALIGPWLLSLIFGDDVHPSRTLTMLVAAGSAFALANLVVTIMIMARGRSAAVIQSWLVAAAGGALVFVASFGVAAPTRTSLAFIAAEGLAFCALAVAEGRVRSRSGV